LDFEWDDAKAQSNFEKHGIPFRAAYVMFDGRPLTTVRSDRGSEARFRSIAMIEGVALAVIWTQRGEVIRVISLRRARTNEERAHRASQRI
jgi:uncharacterized protein